MAIDQSIGNAPPLVVDLDGTLIRSDLLVESAFAWLGASPLRALALPQLLSRGKAALKAAIASETPIDPAYLPYDEQVRALMEDAWRQGRMVYLASASNERYVEAVASHVGADGWFASNDTENLSSNVKARHLVDCFGEQGFDYVGNDQADLPVWAVARKGIAVHPDPGVRRELAAGDTKVDIIETTQGQAKSWIKLIRVHQWSKNALVFVPWLTSHHFDIGSLLDSIVAFFAFSFAASAIYIVNDLVDIEADRKHPSKKQRPLAAGTVPILSTIPLIGGLLTLAAVLAVIAGPLFAVALIAYLVLTTAYTFYLKRKMLIDIVTLAGLYSIRIVGGAAAISVPISEWLLGFSLFIFTSLALIKRYVEMAARLDADLPNPTNRNYRKTDLDIIAALAAASGFNAVTLFTLYISSDTVRKLYSNPEFLWVICPIMLYWLGRVIMMAHRRILDDDPIVFAVRDRNSRLAGVLVVAILVAATIPF